jgi:DnaJ-class molecular chaperone
MDKKVFNPEKYGLVICPSCFGHGYIHDPKRRCCPKCGGFGFIKMELEKDMNVCAGNN